MMLADGVSFLALTECYTKIKDVHYRQSFDGDDVCNRMLWTVLSTKRGS